MDENHVRLKVWGDFACFTRPEFKVERVSYPVITPSAARGILEAILFKPEFRWEIRKITLLKPIRFASIRRNEVQSTISPSNVKQWMQGGEFTPYYADYSGGKFDKRSEETANRTQRGSAILKDVAYIIEAYIDLKKVSKENPPIKYKEMFERRANKGQCFHRPYLGCREFSAFFSLPDGAEIPQPDSRSLGLMLYDMAYVMRGGNRYRDVKETRALFFNANMQNGVIEVNKEKLTHLTLEGGSS